jgi:hypothetical protein
VKKLKPSVPWCTRRSRWEDARIAWKLTSVPWCMRFAHFHRRGRLLKRALAANTQTEERAKTEELEQALEILRQKEEELNQRLLEASTAVATALEKTPAAADQVLPCLGDARNICQHGYRFVWTVKQQEDHVRFFGAAGPPPARCSACRVLWKHRKKWN